LEKSARSDAFKALRPEDLATSAQGQELELNADRLLEDVLKSCLANFPAMET
jgi:hypothetical protein